MTEQPTTAAGRALRMDWISEGRWSRDPQWLTARILAIEVEARQQDGPELHSEGCASRSRHGGPYPVLCNCDAALPPCTPPDKCERHGGYEVASCDQCAALPPSAPPALDVERLAKVLCYSPMHWEVRRPGGAFVMTRMFESADEAAAYIAAEYARLEPER